MARNELARESDEEKSLLDRRSYLQLAGATAATVAGLGSAAGANASSDYLLNEDFESNDYATNFTSNYIVSGGDSDTTFGGQDSLTTSDSYAGSSSLEVELPEGGHWGTAANFDPVEQGAADSECTELHAQYWVKFSSDFTIVKGGKLPGFGNVEPFEEDRTRGGFGGNPSTGTNGWSARGKFKDAGSEGVTVGYYTYHLDMSGSYGDHFDATVVPRGEWVKIDQYIKLNSTSGGSANRDGELKMWVNDTLELEKTGMRFTEEPERGVNYWFIVYFGGKDSSPQTQRINFDRLRVNDSEITDSETSRSTPTDDGSKNGKVFEIVSASDMSTTQYQFTVEGGVQKRTSAGDLSSEGNDSITDNGDGTYTVVGEVGNGYGDSYLVDGTIVSAQFDDPGWTLQYDEQEVTVQELVLPNKLVIDGTDSPNRLCTYEFSVSGNAEKSTDLGSINSYDTVSDGTISGRVIGGKDGFRFSGDITGFTLDGPATVSVEDGS